MATFEKDYCVCGYHDFFVKYLSRSIKYITTCQAIKVYNNDTCLINFTIYLFSCVKFLWTQLASKIYYC